MASSGGGIPPTGRTLAVSRSVASPFSGLLRAQLFSGCEWTSARSSNGLAIAASAWPSKDDAWRRTLRCVDRPGAVIHKREAPSHPDHRTGRRRRHRRS